MISGLGVSGTHHGPITLGKEVLMGRETEVQLGTKEQKSPRQGVERV